MTSSYDDIAKARKEFGIGDTPAKRTPPPTEEERKRARKFWSDYFSKRVKK
jgi:hypothetical protein